MMDNDQMISDQLAEYKENNKENKEDNKEELNDTEIPIKLAIGTPCYGGQCYVDYMESVMNTKILLKEMYGVECELILVKNDSLITRARNNIVARFLADETLTHLIFIDADIGFHPTDVIKLLKADKDIIGGIYPLKNYNFGEIKNMERILKSKDEYEYNKNVMDEDYMRHNLMRYNVNYEDELNEKGNKVVKDEKMEIKDNIMEVKYIPTGFMMIQRHVLEMMIAKYGELKYRDDCGFLKENENKYLYALFDCEIVEGRYLSEDWLFCHRWSEMNKFTRSSNEGEMNKFTRSSNEGEMKGKIYTDVTINLTHIGMHYFVGRYLSTLKIRGK